MHRQRKNYSHSESWWEHHAVGIPAGQKRSSECRKTGGKPNGVYKTPVTWAKMCFPVRLQCDSKYKVQSPRNGLKTMLMSLSGQVRSQSNWNYFYFILKEVNTIYRHCTKSWHNSWNRIAHRLTNKWNLYYMKNNGKWRTDTHNMKLMVWDTKTKQYNVTL